MKILHFSPLTDTGISEYVGMLVDQQKKLGAEVVLCSSVHEVGKAFSDLAPTIVHIHGCWSLSMAVVARKCLGHGIRFVITPHGQLQPWIINEEKAKGKRVKMMLFQNWLCSRASCLIAMGKMEATSLDKLNINRHIEIIRNPMITESISPEETARQTMAAYQKVVDTSTLMLMNDETIDAMSALIKVGICGHANWVNDTLAKTVSELDNDRWRQILLHAHYHNITDIISRGADIMGMAMPELDVTLLPTYNRQASLPDEAVGDDVSGASKMLWLVSQAHKAYGNGRLSFRHLTDITTTIYKERIDEKRLEQLLTDRGLTLFAQRLMVLLEQYTAIDEGYLPIEAANDRTARQMLKPDSLTKCIRL